VSKDLTKREIFQIIMITLVPLGLLLVSYDVYLHRHLVSKYSQHSMDWDANKQDLLSGVKAALEGKLVGENPWIDGDRRYQKAHDLWEEGWFTVFINLGDKARESNH
jgi:hypothetical protein